MEYMDDGTVGTLPVSGKNILKKISLLRFGCASAEHMKTLREELYKYRIEVNRRTGISPISRQAIQSWFEQDREIKRQGAITFLNGYLATTIVKSTISPTHNNLYEQVILFLRLRDHKEDEGGAIESALGSATSAFGLKSDVYGLISESSKRVPRNELNDFFYTTKTTHSNAKDQSYYLVFRHSTLGGVLKSFLVCKRPVPGIFDNYGFVQFVRGGEEFEPDIIRENAGMILKMDRAYYWIGYNYRVPGGKEKMDYRDYQERRIFAKKEPIGMEIIAAEYEQIGLEHGLFSGVIMTIAAMNQPIVARVAFLHLGTTQSLGPILTDEVTTPKELAREVLAEDLLGTVQAMRDAKCERFGRVLDHAVGATDWEAEGASKLAGRILKMIDNSPAWEKIQNTGDVLGRGAIETFSRHHGNRPRP